MINYPISFIIFSLFLVYIKFVIFCRIWKQLSILLKHNYIIYFVGFGSTKW